MYKPSDPVLARFNRRISLPISVWLIRHTAISPNALSLLLVGLAVAVGWLFAAGTYWTSVWGAIVSLAASILDGCDGEIARLKHEETSTGCWLETVGDYLYYLALFAGMTAGVVRSTGREEYGWIGAAALGGSILTFVLLTDLRRNGTTGHPERLQVTARQRFTAGGPAWTRAVNELITVATRSTMPYGILLLTLMNALPLVLVLAAVGANAYWIAMLLRWRNLRRASALTSATLSGASRDP
jgi:phosphatidylglycerophosphate synthase